MGKSDDQNLLQLVQVIDDEGTNLSRSEIDFIADIIDKKISTFNQHQAKRIHAIHEARVVNGEPEFD